MTPHLPHFVARDASGQGRVLALDYGRRRVGLAISDALGLTARPLATLERKNRREDLRRLRGIVREHGVTKILVGLPVHLNGSASEMAAETQRFARRIHKELALPVELVDERLTSWEAKHTAPETATCGAGEGARRRGKGAKSPQSRRKGGQGIDALAAAVILRQYLEEHPAAKAGRD